MAPSVATEDYYKVLEIDQWATPEEIVRSYRRLAKKLHPDRGGATKDFQLLGQAYETLNDVGKRREYDLIYPSIAGERSSQQNTRPPPPTSSESRTEAVQIAALKRSKDERALQWRISRQAFESAIFEIQRNVHKLEQEIKNLASIATAEAAEEAQKNSWGTWLLSPLYKKVEQSEEEKSRLDRARQERRIEQDLKERRLASAQSAIQEKQGLQSRAQKEHDAANFRDDQSIRAIELKIQARADRERQEKERLERLAREKKWKQEREDREKREKIIREAEMKRQAEARAAEQARQEEERKKQQRGREEALRQARMHPRPSKTYTTTTTHTRSAGSSGCVHSGSWPKVEGRTACPECREVWTYLLSCPSCSRMACPKCQYNIRHQYRSTGRVHQRQPPRPRSPSPYSYYHDGW